jgi:hypothetical protein
LAAIGLRLEDVIDESPVEVWEENWVPLQIMQAIGTQWRTTQGAVVGLDYNVLPLMLKLFGIKKRAKQAETLECLQVMEAEALRIVNRRDH